MTSSRNKGQPSPEQIQLLGTMYDKDWAKMAGVARNTAMAIRKAHGIAAFSDTRPLGWQPPAKIKKLIGKRPDHEVAELAKVPIGRVVIYRHQHRIRGFHGTTEAKRAKIRELTWQPSPEHQALIGKMSDVKMADLAQVSPNTVLAYRRRHGIPSFRENGGTKKWHPSREQIDRLGTETDSQLAREFGVNHQLVTVWRKKLGIPVFTRIWDPSPKQISQLGKLSDIELSQRWGVSVSTIATYRHANEIAAFTPSTWQPSADQLALLGKITDLVMAIRAGVTEAQVYQYRKEHGIKSEMNGGVGRKWQPSSEIAALLGKFSDGEIARRAGVDIKSVLVYRRTHGIQPYSPKAEGAVKKKVPAKWRPGPDLLALLGKISDTELAARAGVARQIVSKHRIDLKIKKFVPVKRTKWQPSPEIFALLGERKDKEVAALAKVSEATVLNYRKSLGIKSLKSKYVPKGKPWQPSAENAALLGLISDAEIARREKVDNLTVGNYRRRQGIASFRIGAPPVPKWKTWQPSAENAALLGIISDAKIARMENVDNLTVGNYRRRLGIAPFRIGAPRQDPLPMSDLPALLGTQSDKKLAKLFGFESTRVIEIFRQQMGK